MTPAQSWMIKFRKAHSYAKRYGLSDDDRIQLAEVLLWRDVESWKVLTEPELTRLLDALEGFALISHLVQGQEASKASTAS